MPYYCLTKNMKTTWFYLPVSVLYYLIWLVENSELLFNEPISDGVIICMLLHLKALLIGYLYGGFYEADQSKASYTLFI